MQCLYHAEILTVWQSKTAERFASVGTTRCSKDRWPLVIAETSIIIIALIGNAIVQCLYNAEILSVGQNKTAERFTSVSTTRCSKDQWPLVIALKTDGRTDGHWSSPRHL